MTRKSLVSRVVADWPAKVLSLAAALLIFMFYRLNRLEERFVSVPLSVTLGDGYVPSTILPRSVRLTLRGEPADLVTILEEDLRASVDLSGARAEGLLRSPVVVERKGSALGVDPLEIAIEPQEVTANLERKARKTVPITPSFRGYLEAGYELASFDLVPSEAEITGPASAISRVLDLSTDFIELTGRKEDFTAEVRVFPKESLVTVGGTGTSVFKATVQEAIEYRRYEGVVPLALGLADAFVLAEPLAPVTLRIQSGKAQIAGFSPPPDAVTLNLSAIRRVGTYTLPFVVKLPEGFALEGIDPVSVAVRVVAAGGATR